MAVRNMDGATVHCIFAVMCMLLVSDRDSTLNFAACETVH